MINTHHVIKKVGGATFLFDSENMLVFDITEGFDEFQYEDIISTLKQDTIQDFTFLPKMVLNISNLCNYKCVYCYAEHGNYGRVDAYMSVDTLNNIILELKNKGIERIGVIELFGGEPTLNPELYTIAELLSKNFRVPQFLLTTNGSGDKSIVQRLISYPMKYIISLDGPMEINDLLRGKGSYENAIEFMNEVKSFKIPFEISATYTKKHFENHISYDDLYFFALSLNAPLRINTVITTNNELATDCELTKDRLLYELDRTLDIIKLGEVSINLDPYVIRLLKGIFFSIQSTKFCNDLDLGVSIHYDYDGSIYHCYKLWKDERFSEVDLNANNEILQLMNAKENLSNCRTCWANLLCEVCVVDTFLGNDTFPFRKQICPIKMRYNITLTKILERIVNNEIVAIRNNFYKYIM